MRFSSGVYPSTGSRPSLALVCFASIGGIAFGADEPAAKLPPPGGDARRMADEPVWVDASRRRVAVDGRVCLREGVLEMFACPAQTKEHESIVAVESSAFLLHTALLAAGAEPGRPARFEPDFRPPEGPEIEITVEWIDEAGTKRTARAQEWIRETASGDEMKLPFVFAGSGFWIDPDSGRQRYLADSGDLVCVSNFGTAMLDVPTRSTQANAELMFEPFTERIPPVDTPVRVWFAVATKKTAAPRAEGATEGVGRALAALEDVDVSSGSSATLRHAWTILAESDAAELVTLLRALGGASTPQQNWLRTAIDAASGRQAAEGTLPVDALERFLADSSGDPRSRRVAYEILAAARPASAAELLAGLVDDPSLELRFDAIAALLERAESAEADERKRLLRTVERSSRSLPQIEAAAKGLKQLGEEVDLVESLGFVADWRVIGPFENRDGVGFDAVYPPEETLDAAATYEGRPDDDSEEPASVAWKSHRTDDRLGEVDLNAAVGAHKGATAYAWATIECDRPGDVQLRYSSWNATKLWVNGERVASHETYHSGSGFDQYRADARLRAGENQVLLKVCQNEQTEPWAQVWGFRLRVCDDLGGAIPDLTAAGSSGGAE